MNDDPARDILVSDEILELLYWLEGEGFGSGATVPGLLRFLACGEQEVRQVLTTLQQRDLVVSGDDQCQRLTPAGRREAARRFQDDFADLMHRGHGECSDPACDCHTSPGGAAACHARLHDADAR